MTLSLSFLEPRSIFGQVTGRRWCEEMRNYTELTATNQITPGQWVILTINRHNGPTILHPHSFEQLQSNQHGLYLITDITNAGSELTVTLEGSELPDIGTGMKPGIFQSSYQVDAPMNGSWLVLTASGINHIAQHMNTN